jgi:hypothetical protein
LESLIHEKTVIPSKKGKKKEEEGKRGKKKKERKKKQPLVTKRAKNTYACRKF